MLQQKHEVDVAKYAKLERTEQGITLIWEEFRDIFRVEVKYSDPSMLSDAKLQYWQHHWLHQRVPKGVPVGAGGVSSFLPEQPAGSARTRHSVGIRAIRRGITGHPGEQRPA